MNRYGSADVILIPEIPFDLDKVCKHIMSNVLFGQDYAIVVAAEGAIPKGGHEIVKEKGELGREGGVLGGVGEYVAKEIAKRTGKDTRSLVLGHLQRGGSPTTFDRLLALRFGAAAVRMVEEQKYGVMVSFDPPEVRPVPLEKVVGGTKQVPVDSDSIKTAREIGISFGD